QIDAVQRHNPLRPLAVFLAQICDRDRRATPLLHGAFSASLTSSSPRAYPAIGFKLCRGGSAASPSSLVGPLWGRVGRLWQCCASSHDPHPQLLPQGGGQEFVAPPPHKLTPTPLSSLPARKSGPTSRLQGEISQR